MTPDLKSIYELLPAVYRTRDAQLALKLATLLSAAEKQELETLLSIASPLTAAQERRLEDLQEKQQTGPLKALVSVIAQQVMVLRESLQQAYDDQFIETCQEWVVPYIGDLVGARGLFVFENASFSLRGEVAGTLANRRRKGTVAALESLAREVTDWDVNVVEFFSRLATTQYMNHVRLENLSVLDVRTADDRPLNTPFDPDAHTVDVRNIATRRGKYSIPNIGVFVWRIPSQPMLDSPASRLDDRRYFFDVLGRDTQLYPVGSVDDPLQQRATPLTVPMPIARRRMYKHEGEYAAANITPQDVRRSNLSIGVHYTLSSSPPDSPLASPPDSLPICTCNLSDVVDAGGKVRWAHQPAESIGIDPELGRMAFPKNYAAPADVHVSYHYGFSAEIGGGQYERTFADPVGAVITVPGDYLTVQQALAAAVQKFTDEPELTSLAVEIQNNEVFRESPSFIVPAHKSLQLRAKSTCRPVLLLPGDFNIVGEDGSAVNINGLLIAGASLVIPPVTSAGIDNQVQLQLAHCTLYPGDVPPRPNIRPDSRLVVEAAAGSVSIENSIVGTIRATETSAVTIENSIVDALDETNVAYASLDAVSAAGPLTVRNSTIIGKVHTRRLELASNTIFVAEVASADAGQWDGPVISDQLQQGCVRFSYVPPGARVPRRYQCHPSDADKTPVSPQFTSLRLGDPGYCQLAPQSGIEILQGADDQAEMGSFHNLYQPQREANLRTRLQEYLRFGLEAGVFYAS